MMTLRENEGRSFLDAARLASVLVQPGGLWRQVRVAAETGSTNADLLAEAAAGAEEGIVLAAEVQTAGRGRLGRSWASAPGAGLTFSVLLRPEAVPVPRHGWLPLLAGVAVAEAARETAAVGALLKWPNDVVADDRKLAGILAESRGRAVVIGIGINVSTQQAELPVPTATSLLLARAAAGHGEPAGPGRDEVLAATLTALARWYSAWTGAGGDPDACGLHAEYLRLCATVGREVKVTLPGGRELAGLATGVDRAGRLAVRTASGLTEVSAGDVVHVR
jgi:BirA family biotin operon repressor/biotin-[acetyl-CoA-carboxylase] ligase